MSGQDERGQVAREVVELGEELFELALRGCADVGDENEAAATLAELRAAADEFFRVLRGLLAVEEYE